MKKAFLLLLPLLLVSCGYRVYTPRNQTNARGYRHGMWKTYWDNGNLMMKTCYKHGKERGIARTYYQNGEPVSTFKYHKKYVKAKFFDTLGNVEMKGRAKLFYDKDSVFTFYWFGKWKFFDSKHRLLEYGYYSEGKEDSVFIPKRKKRFFRFR